MSQLSIPLPAFLPILDAEAAEFGSLPDECRADIRARYSAIRECLSAQHSRGVGEMWDRAAARLAGNRGGSLTGKRLRNLATDYVRSAAGRGVGDWRTLWNTSRWQRSDYRPGALPVEFIELEWKPRILRELPSDSRNSRLAVGGIRRAHEKLITDWRRARAEGTHPFRGYSETPAPAPGSKMPAGWSYSNLTEKNHCPSEAERVAWRKGTGKARFLLPYVRSSRAELLAGQRYEIDDFEPDLQVIFNQSRVKPLQLSAYDFASGCIVDACHKPAYRRDDGTTDKWKAAHIPLFIAAMFTRCPYDAVTGTTIVDEGGTAKIGADLQQLLAEMTGGRIGIEGAQRDENGLVEYGNIQRANRERLGQIAGFQGGDRGNSNRKRMESWHLRYRNALGSLPGQTGSNYTDKPEWLAGVEKTEDRLLKLALTMPPERALAIRHNLLSFAEFVRDSRELIESVNARTEHDLEGWARFTLDSIADERGTWHPLADLALMPAEAASAILTLAERDPSLFCAARKLSPSAAWTRETRQGIAAGRLRTLHPWDAAEIIALAGKAEPELRTIRTRSVRAAYIVVRDTTVAMLPEPIFYSARIAQPNGEVRELRNGEDVEIIFNPFAPEILFVRSEKGRFLGVAKRDHGINPNIRAEVLAAYAEAKRRRGERLAPIKASMAADVAATVSRARHNDRVTDLSQPYTDAEHTAADALAAARAAVAERLNISRQNTPQNTEIETY